MIDINQEIRSLLFDHDYVTVPGLGAFIAHYEPSVYDSDSNSFSPPNRRISFNSVLKQDDGLLTSTLMKKSGVNSSKAKEMLSDYVQEVKNVLVADQFFEVKEVGVLELSKDQKVVFAPSTCNFFNESYGFDTLYSFNNSNFTYSKKYFDESITETDQFEVDTMDIAITKVPKKPLRTKILYALPLVVLVGGLVSILILNPTTTDNASSSLNPLDYIKSAQSWFDKEPINNEKPLVLNEGNSDGEKELPLVQSAESLKMKLVIGVFTESSNANMLYNKLVLNDFVPKIMISDDKSTIFVEVASQNEANQLSEKLEQLIGERGVLLNN